MRKLILVFLMFISCSAWADKHYGTKWVRVDATAAGDATFYIDPTTIRRDGPLHRYWQLVDRKVKNKNGVLSWRVREELDCKKERKRITSLTSFSDSMLEGRIIDNHTTTDDEWTDVPPDTVDESIMKFVCAR